LCNRVQLSLREKLREEKGESQVQMTIDSELYIDSGLLSGLAAMSEIRELLDELYGNLAWAFSKELKTPQKEIGEPGCEYPGLVCS
jgi:hypothetical protein